MLLTILNLPSNVKYSDIKTLVQSKCHIEDLIMDNLSPHENNTKKITIGLSGEEDAAIVMRNINGLYMDGRQLLVIKKTKTSDANVNIRPTGPLPDLHPSGPGIQPPGLNVRSQASNWFNNFNTQEPGMGNQNTTQAIPPLMSFGSQTAYYQMNQPTYAAQSTPLAAKVAYPELQSYGSKRNQSDNQNDWSSNNWNQQSSGFSSTQENKNLSSRWDNQESKYIETEWGNPDSKWNNNSDSNRDNDRNSNSNSRPVWDKDNDSKWSTNQRSKRDRSRDLKRDRSPVSEMYLRRDIERDTNRDSYRSNQSFGQQSNVKTRNDSSHRRGGQDTVGSGRSKDSSYTRQDQNNSRSRRDPYIRNDQSAGSSRHVSSSMRNDRNNRSSGHDSSTMRNDRNYARSSRRDSDRNNARSSRRDSPYNRNDQVNFKTARHDFPYTKNDENNDGSLLSNMYGDHVTDSAKRARDEGPRQNETNYSARPVFDRRQSPPAKRSRFSNLGDIQAENKDIVFEQKMAPIRRDIPTNVVFEQIMAPIPRDIPKNKVFEKNMVPKPSGGPTVSKNIAAQKGPVGQQMGQVQDETSPWRAQITRTVAKRTMLHKCCLYEGVKIPDLEKKIRVAVRSRLDSRLQKKKYISAKQMAQIYYSKFDHATHCDLIKENVEALGGRMIYQKNRPEYKLNVVQPQGPQPKPPAKEYKLNVVQPQRPQPKPPVKQYKLNVVQPQRPQPKPPVKPQSIPLAQIPGRIPQYPQGDKGIYKKQKKDSANLFNDHSFLADLMSSLPPAIKKAIEEETDVLDKIIEEACDYTDPDAAEVIDMFKYIFPQKMKNITKVNLTKRMLPLLPIQVSAFSTPKVHRLLLEQYLSDYNVCCLKRCKSKPFYLIDCNSVEDHDKLCSKGTVRIGQSTITFKPFHLAGVTKVTKYDIYKQRDQFKSMQIRYFDNLFNDTSKNSFDVIEEIVDNVPVKQEVHSDIDIKEEQLCQDIKRLHDQINEPVNIKNENIKNINANIHLTTTDIINDGDFTTDVDFENFGKEDINDGWPVGQVGATSWFIDEVGEHIDNNDTGISEPAQEMKTEKDKNDKILVEDKALEVDKVLEEDKPLKEDNVLEENKPLEEDIDIADVNEDDLEDW